MTETPDVIDHEERLRRRLAERLHDGPIQDLTAAQLFLETALYSGDVAGGVERAGAMLRDASLACRRFMDALSPALEGDAELAARVEVMAREVAELTTVRLQPPPGLGRRSPAVTLALYRAAEELLDNVRRHAGAALDAVTIEAAGGEVVLTIRDRGPGGCPPPERARGGLGVTQDRVRALGGAVRVEEATPGTTVTVTVPLAAGGGIGAQGA